MSKSFGTVIVAITIIALASIGLNIYFYIRTASLSGTNNVLGQEKMDLNSQIKTLQDTKEQLEGRIASIDKDLQSVFKIKGIVCDTGIPCLSDILVEHEARTRLAQVSFSSPYLVVWQVVSPSPYDAGRAELSVLSASLGEINAPKGLKKTAVLGNYNENEKVYALTFDLKVKVLQSGGIYLTMRRVVDEEGAEAPPNSQQFYFPDSGGLGAQANYPYPPQQVIFVVSESEKTFLFHTGGTPDIFFNVSRLNDGSLRLEKIQKQE